MPMSRATMTATVRLRSRAATTAANDSGDEEREVVGVEPDDGGGQHAGQPGEEGADGPDADGDGVGLVPERSVMAGESTMARTLSPTSV